MLYTFGKGKFGRLGHGMKDSYTLSEKSKLVPCRVGDPATRNLGSHVTNQRFTNGALPEN